MSSMKELLYRVDMMGSVYEWDSSFPFDLESICNRLPKSGYSAIVYCTKDLLDYVQVTFPFQGVSDGFFINKGNEVPRFICDLAVTLRDYTFYFICKGNIEQSIVVPEVEVYDLARECIILKHK